MPQTAFVTGADRGSGFALTTQLLERGWWVIVGQYPPDWPDLAGLAARFPTAHHRVSLDVGSEESTRAAAVMAATMTDRIEPVISNAGVGSPTSPRAIREPQDYAEMHRPYDVNALGALPVVGALLPLTDMGSLKRLCFVSSEAGNIARAQRTAWFGYCMSKAALNMGRAVALQRPPPAGLYFPGLSSGLDPGLHGG